MPKNQINLCLIDNNICLNYNHIIQIDLTYHLGKSFQAHVKLIMDQIKETINLFYKLLYIFFNKKNIMRNSKIKIIIIACHMVCILLYQLWCIKKKQKNINNYLNVYQVSLLGILIIMMTSPNYFVKNPKIY